MQRIRIDPVLQPLDAIQQKYGNVSAVACGQLKRVIDIDHLETAQAHLLHPQRCRLRIFAEAAALAAEKFQAGRRQSCYRFGG